MSDWRVKVRAMLLTGRAVAASPSAEPLGYPIARPEDLEAASILGCIRKSEARYMLAGSTEEPCSSCGEAVLVAPDAPAEPVRVCMQCVMEKYV